MDRSPRFVRFRHLVIVTAVETGGRSLYTRLHVRIGYIAFTMGFTLASKCDYTPLTDHSKNSHNTKSIHSAKDILQIKTLPQKMNCCSHKVNLKARSVFQIMFYFIFHIFVCVFIFCFYIFIQILFVCFFYVFLPIHWWLGCFWSFHLCADRRALSKWLNILRCIKC